MRLLLEGEKTSRLNFRKITPSDFNSWLPFHEEPLSTQYWEGEKKSAIEACKEQFKCFFERYSNNTGGMNALINTNTNDFIGICGLLEQKVDSISEIEIGYSILPKYWKQGYASEAAKKCKYFAIANKISESIISIIHIDNIPSQKVAIANGMFLDKTTTYKENPVHIYRIEL